MEAHINHSGGRGGDRGRGDDPIVLPRGLILLGFAWLMVSWAMAMGFQPPLHPSAASYEPGVKMMLLSLMIGITIAWPLYRLSQPPASRPILQTVLDLLVLLAMSQVVIWPLRLVTTWSRLTTAAMDVGLIAWTVLIGAIIASSIGSARRGPRTLAMAACLGLALIVPALAWLGAARGVVNDERSILSPLLFMHALAEARGFNPSASAWLHLAVVGAAAMLAWVAVGFAGLKGGRGGAGEGAAGGSTGGEGGGALS